MTILLHFCLAAAFWFGLQDLPADNFFRPFPIAIRDEDHTLMSRSLTNLIRKEEVFSEVRVLTAGETDEEALDDGAAAVVTIPKDFFYKMYVDESCPAVVTLNGDRPLDAAVFRSILTSVMDIITSGHAAERGVYRFVYGDIPDDRLRAMYDEAELHLFGDALGRQNVFDTASEAVDLLGTLRRHIAAAVLGMLAILGAASAVRTLPDELRSGVLPRFRCQGGSTFSFILSKYLVLLLYMAPVTALMTVLLHYEIFSDGPGGLARGSGSEMAAALAGTLLLTLFETTVSFFVLLAAAVWLRNSPAVQRFANLWLLLSLCLGGILRAQASLPRPLAILGTSTVPSGFLSGFEALSHEAGLSELAACLAPNLLLLAAALLLFFPRLSYALHHPDGTAAQGSKFRKRKESKYSRHGVFCRIATLTPFKCRLMTGAAGSLLALLLVSAFCGAVSASMPTDTAAGIRIVIVDFDKTADSRELCDRLIKMNGLRAEPAQSPSGAQILLDRQMIEGVLSIGEGYGDTLGAGDPLPLHYEAASSSSAGIGVREIIAGAVQRQNAMHRAIPDAEGKLGRALTAEEQETLFDLIRDAEKELPPLYTVRTAGGMRADDLFTPQPAHFAVLVLLLTLLMLSTFTGTKEARLVNERLHSMPHGILLSLGSDLFAELIIGIGLLFAFLAGFRSMAAFIGAPLFFPAMLAFLVFAACLSLVVSFGTEQEGRVDGLAPFLAMILCLLGGCFSDLSAASGIFRILSYLSPAGLAVHGAGGKPHCILLLLAEAAVFLLIALLQRGKHDNNG